MKENCWQVKKCGKEDQCPAANEAKLNGMHGGMQGGRSCWAIGGTFCSGGKADGAFSQKFTSCMACEFFQQVKEEETMQFRKPAVLLAKLNAA